MLVTSLVIDNEEARINALRDLRLLDTPPSESFDRLTRLASRLLGTPVSTISLTDRDRQWFKSRVGMDFVEIPRAQAPCSYAIRSRELFVIPDLLRDERFETSPLAQAGIRFYAGAPLITRAGFGLGTLAVIDDKPRQIVDEERNVLRDLAGMVMMQIELQNTIGRVDATSGHPNEHQLFEDLDELAARNAGEERIGLMVELAAPHQVSHGMRVLGAAYVEELIRSASLRIRRRLEPGTRLYQVSPTRCAVILEGTERDGHAAIAASLAQCLREPISCAEIPVTPHPVIGTHLFRLGEVKPRDVLRRLFNAADDARGAGSLVAGYSEAQDHAHARSFKLLHDIRHALQRPGELHLVYQPRVDLASGSCVGAEALLRWHHPTLGSVSPGEFIPLVEQTAFVGQVTDWVFEAAIAQVAHWQRNPTTPRVSINASAINLEEVDFADRLARMLDRHGVAPGAIELEFTESALARDGRRVLDQLLELRNAGIEVAIDDFGTGYSSLAYLHQLPASVLKIDRSFMLAVATGQRDQTLVRAMIGMAHDLGFRVVAEGIETRDVYDLLAEWRCDEAQGYFISRPLPPSILQDWLACPGRQGSPPSASARHADPAPGRASLH